ncbi:MAG: hypothetical protein FH748_11995 [Balneolaceae bacterium]|nr:hypothetical protein [Balneolaceae bacterium]
MVLFVLTFLFTAPDLLAQVGIGADVVSRYVWRGTDFGNAPAVQPYMEVTSGDFTIGAWGSYELSANTGGTEADLYISYSIDDFSIGITDYYFPSVFAPGNYFDFEDSHTYELNLGYGIDDFSISANYYFAGNANDDLYFEATYAVSNVELFAGIGNESYSTTGDFEFVNFGLTTSKDIKISDEFSLPVFSSFILNPDSERIFLLFGFSL